MLLTYLLTTLDFTCLFMQFSILPVSTPPSPPWGPPARGPCLRLS